MRRVLAWLNLNRVATALGVLALVLLSGVIGAQTNYLGTVFIADSTTPSQQAGVTASGEVKVDCTTGCSGGGGGTSNVNLIQIGGSTIAIGQAAMAASLPVAIASNQSSIPVAAALQAGSAIAGKFGIDQTTPGTTNAVQSIPGSSGGLGTPFSANVTNAATAVDASPGQMYGYAFYNGNTSVCYIQLFDLATGSVTLGATSPRASIGVPANALAQIWMTQGSAYATAITIAATTTRTGSTACSNGIDGNVWYK